MPVVGFVVGVFSSFTGLGGAMILTPTLSMLFGLSYPTAISCTVAQMVGMSASGLWRHWRLGHVDGKLALNFLGGSVPGAVLGRLLLQRLDARFGGGGRLRVAFHLIFGIILVAGAAGMLVKAIRWSRRRRGGESRPSSRPRLQAPVGRALAVGASGLLAGLLAGLLSLGGGVVTVPVLVALLGVPVTVAVGTSVFQMSLMAVAATLVSVRGHELDWQVILLLLVGSVPGAALGPLLLGRVAARFQSSSA